MPYGHYTWGHKPSTKISEFIAEVEDFRGRKWELYEMFDKPSDKGWRNFKVRVRGQCGGRANYTLGWNAELGRFAKGSEQYSIELHHSILFKAICSALKHAGIMRKDWQDIAISNETTKKG